VTGDSFLRVGGGAGGDSVGDAVAAAGGV